MFCCMVRGCHEDGFPIEREGPHHFAICSKHWDAWETSANAPLANEAAQKSNDPERWFVVLLRWAKTVDTY